jgi:hypothetical protein
MPDFDQKQGSMARQKRMDQIRTILRNYLDNGCNVKLTARQLKVSRNTVREYLRRAACYSGDLSAVLNLDDEAFSRIVYPSSGEESSDRLAVFEQQLPYWLKELGRVGVTRELLWQEYRREHPDGYSQFCERLRQHIRQRDLTLALEHTPGRCLCSILQVKKWLRLTLIPESNTCAKYWLQSCPILNFAFAWPCPHKV